MSGEAGRCPGGLPLACACGGVRGAIRRAGPNEGDRVVCHCADCQAFVRWCGAEDCVFGRGAGTDLYQSRCARLSVEAGLGQLACVHLTAKPTLRWYAACCNTPMFNTFANGRLPYLTTVVANTEERWRDELLGPVKGHLFHDEAPGGGAAFPPMTVAKLMGRWFGRTVRDTVSGDRRRSPLFDPKTLRPIVPARRLAPRERQLLEVAGG